MTRMEADMRTYKILKFVTGAPVSPRWNVTLTGARGPKSFRTEAECDAWVAATAATLRASGHSVEITGR